MTKTCPHCGGALATTSTTTPDGYTVEFETFWKAYDAPKIIKTASKKDAYKAWQQTESERPPLEVLLACVRAYRKYIADPKNKLLPCHPSTWLRQARYENFKPAQLTAIPGGDSSRSGSLSVATDNVDPSWEEYAPLLEAELGRAKFLNWFRDAILVRKPAGPVEIVVSSTFRRDWIEKYYSRELYKVLGIYEVVVKPAPLSSR